MTPASGAAAPRVLVVWCPAWERGTESDARAFEQVVTLVERFCPRVEVLRPGVCAIGARGPARYFGGEKALAEKIIDAVACLGVACQVGVADGLFAAQLAAQTPWPGQAVIVAPGTTRKLGAALAAREGIKAPDEDAAEIPAKLASEGS